MTRKKPLSNRSLHRVLVIDSQPLYRVGLVHTLAKSGLFEVCLESENYILDRETFAWIEPDIIIMDMIYSGISPFDFIRWVRENYPSIPVLVLSMLDEKIFAERVLKAGAKGYVMKTADGRSIAASLKSIVKNELSVSETISAHILKKYVDGGAEREAEPHAVLTDRELEVFHLVGSGKTSREIARILNISVKTADNHKTSIREKLSLKNHIELSQKAVLWCNQSGEIL